MEEIRYMADIIDVTDLRADAFNLITGGCGTGKTYFCSNYLLDRIEGVKPSEVIFISSRAITVNQMCQDESNEKFTDKDLSVIKYWNGVDDDMNDSYEAIKTMTYDKIIGILKSKNSLGYQTLSRVKVVICDECHTLFSDGFIKDIEPLKLWIRGAIYNKEKIIIGITATPGIVHFYEKQWGVAIHQVNNDILIRYKANKLVCTDFFSLPHLFDTGFIKGRTIVLCKTIKDCYELQAKIKNAAILVSEDSKHFTPDMKRIRETIIRQSTLPDTFTFIHDDKTQEERRLDVLIATSTLREGFNLLASSNIKNVISCFTDELHVAQFLGRCRFDVEYLIVAAMHHNEDNLENNEYLAQSRKSYKQFASDFSNHEWFDSVEHLVKHSWYETMRRYHTEDIQRFIDYLNETWLVPTGISKKEMRKYMIYKNEDKENLLNLAHDCRLLGMPKCKLTFNRVLDYIEELGYTVHTLRTTINKQKFTYKLISGYDEPNKCETV